MNLILISSVAAVFMMIVATFIRLKASAKPVSPRKIILPPFFMSTGALMYVVPMFRLNRLEILEAIVVGLIFSIFLIKTSKFEVRDQQIYLKRSKAFVFILIGLLVARIAFKTYLSQTISFGELSGMFFLLAFSMIVSWRIAMYRSYKKLEATLKDDYYDKNMKFT
ncbi:cytochrome c biogenesis protein CcdC [Ectobacillus antri]|uniref:Cytochrome c biogenesis protein CcdC n=1 Tax=Ectobacillus antri TaxID=2486280 RepID=A0ABT6H231_9BACI|nr:cytochrome c biogenesis protein CcdC [Ectobacillus antri]MDG4656015.1 cytochrome c biogenesis protein CcdC [Ectobacillus antri]MDG5752690.1 cytochrome c biogenesis protein CcdC [Ectobacillus antri]